ncbi:conserved hypothetical protein [Desulfamplus magnetovallimortis]|uniref:Uncharacterized protein n=1 Tax=Desulfamplus magnetovallimortis TaxID=1246637 RepID=A0A1W1HEL2_9BACT|nr:hypothetical protein [Desulfamplus magnetovallimortis]SLM30866.1 conserved hypothetical protein [Desulfamplus magnetovallimortis]
MMTYQESLKKQGVICKEQLQQRLQEIFEKVEHQSSAITEIYKMFFPDWERIKQIEGYPVVGQEMWKYICNLFIAFDQQHHPDCFSGGIWLNNGFSSSDKLAPWEISFDECKIIYS